MTFMDNDEKLAGAANHLLDSMNNPNNALKILIISGLIESSVFGLGAIFRNTINNLNPNSKIFLSLILFGIGFFVTFGVVRLFDLGERKTTTRTNEFMGGYANISEKNRQWKFWLISTAVGVVNVILFFLMIQLFINGTLRFPF